MCPSPMCGFIGSDKRVHNELIFRAQFVRVQIESIRELTSDPNLIIRSLVKLEVARLAQPISSVYNRPT